MDTLQRRLGRATLALEASDRRIAELEAENEVLREVIKIKDKIIAEQAALIIDLKQKNRVLQGELVEAKRAAKTLESGARRRRRWRRWARSCSWSGRRVELLSVR